MDNTAVQEKRPRQWTMAEHRRFIDSGGKKVPAWWRKQKEEAQAPDHNTGRKLCQSALRKKYEEFIARYPWLIDEVVSYAQMVKAQGRESYGMRLILERIRWDFEIGEMHDAPELIEGELRTLKINNNHLPFLSRDVMSRCPDLAGFFEVREQTHAQG